MSTKTAKIIAPRLVLTPASIYDFVLMADLGIITAPASYDSATCLKSFCEQEEKNLLSCHPDINDWNFSKPSRLLKRGDQLRVSAFGLISPRQVTSEVFLELLASKRAVYPGAQGLSLVFQQKRNELPKGCRYTSFDEKDRLPRSLNWHSVALIHALSCGDFILRVSTFEGDWQCGGNAVLCFQEV